MRFSKLLLLPLICVPLAVIGTVALPYIFFWFTILPLVGFVFLLIGSPLIVYLWYKRVPYAARLIAKAKAENKPLAIIAHDTGRAALTLITERLGEGIVNTLEGKFKILPQFAPASVKPKKKEGSGSGNPGDSEEDSQENDQVYEKDYRDFVTKRTILTGLELPLFVAYSGKLCLLNPEALALFEAGEMQVKDSSGNYIHLERQAENEGNGYIQKATKKLGKLLQPAMLLDPRKIKDLISRQFDVTQIAAIIAESEQIGRLGKPGLLGKFALPLGILLIVLVVGLILLFVGPNFAQQLGSGV